MLCGTCGRCDPEAAPQGGGPAVPQPGRPIGQGSKALQRDVTQAGEAGLGQVGNQHKGKAGLRQGAGGLQIVTEEQLLRTSPREQLVLNLQQGGGIAVGRAGGDTAVALQLIQRQALLPLLQQIFQRMKGNQPQDGQQLGLLQAEPGQDGPQQPQLQKAAAADAQACGPVLLILPQPLPG